MPHGADFVSGGLTDGRLALAPRFVQQSVWHQKCGGSEADSSELANEYARWLEEYDQVCPATPTATNSRSVAQYSAVPRRP